jgi:hypothetical protein
MKTFYRLQRKMWIFVLKIKTKQALACDNDCTICLKEERRLHLNRWLA